MKNKDKGELVEHIVIVELMKRSIVCSEPVGDNQPYDLVIELNNKLLKVQVRTCLKVRNTLRVSFQSQRINTKRKYAVSSAKKVDLFIGYSFETNKVYVVGKNILSKNSNSVMLRLSKPKNNQVKKIKFAQDYELDKFLKEYRELGEMD